MSGSGYIRKWGGGGVSLDILGGRVRIGWIWIY